MNLNKPQIIPVVSIILFFIIGFCIPFATEATPRVSTEKDVYQYGETIRVSFYNAPGIDRDWISIAPAGAPDNEPGDYQYTPKGVNQGVLSFNSPNPGKYEVRAYYNYNRNVYQVSARHVFSVEGTVHQERKIDVNNPLEANIPNDKGLIYLFREPLFITNNMEIPIKTGGKPIIVMPNSSYFQFISPPGPVTFTVDSFFDNNTPVDQTKKESPLFKAAEITHEIKPGFVYYLRIKTAPGVCIPDYVAHQEGAASIKNYNLTLIK